MIRFTVSIISLFLFASLYVEAERPTTYEYLKNLCPEGYLPLSGKAHVRTCDDICPTDSICIQGICCIKPPVCLDTKFRFSTGFSCLPKIKQNCPSDTLCVPSSRAGMSICCADKAMRRSPISTSLVPNQSANGVCPASYPVVRHENKHLVLCKDCKNGICVPFRGSDVSICCQSYGSLCGVGSHVKLDGVLARDCSKIPCDRGFECTTTSTGSQVCCSYAVCSSGKRARSVCAGGCRLDEKCEEIQGQRWCCPLQVRQLECPNNRRSNGEKCSIFNNKCPVNYTCMESNVKNSFICCQDEDRDVVTQPPFIISTRKSALTVFSSATSTPVPRKIALTLRPNRIASVITTSTTSSNEEDDDEENEEEEDEISEVPICTDGNLPMTIQDTYLICPEEGAPCPRAGYICSKTLNSKLYCCPLAIDNWLVTAPIVPKRNSATGTSPMPLSPRVKPIMPIPIESDPPTCWFGHTAARYEHNNEIRRCTGFLDISCPFEYKCLPSASTTGFLCCKG